VNSRCCSRTACKQSPVYTLTYVYKDSTAVLGPLAVYVDPHSWDLCEMHAARLVVPRGWDVVRLPKDPAQERADDLEALANVVRDVARAERASAERAGLEGGAPARPAPPVRQAEPLRQVEPRQAASGTVPRPGVPQRLPAEPVGQGVEVSRRGHLRVLRSAPAPQPEA
jgi:Protein of unknown function (DUF3499)